MGDATGKLTHGLHFLPVAQGLFGPCPLEDLALQLQVGLGQRPGAFGHALLKGFVKLKQGLFGGSGLQTLAAPRTLDCHGRSRV